MWRMRHSITIILPVRILRLDQDAPGHEGAGHAIKSYTGGLKGWMAPVQGVVTEYLPNYLGWYRKLEREGEALMRMSCVAAALA